LPKFLLVVFILRHSEKLWKVRLCQIFNIAFRCLEPTHVLSIYFWEHFLSEKSIYTSINLRIFLFIFNIFSNEFISESVFIILESIRNIFGHIFLDFKIIHKQCLRCNLRNKLCRSVLNIFLENFCESLVTHNLKLL
jgi:hypothetical protein